MAIFNKMPKSKKTFAYQMILGAFCILSLWQLPAQSANQVPSDNAVLSPSQFSGNAALGYAAAKEVPDICSKLFCYCGCDLTDSHVSLLDCFTGDHGVDCTICQEEAIIALHLHKSGKNLAQIQDAIDRAFAPQYPWEKPSDALKKYRQSIKIPISSTEGNTVDELPADDLLGSKKHSRSGSCCGHNHS